MPRWTRYVVTEYGLVNLKGKSVPERAKAIKAAVSTRKMPPWSADPHVGKFSNDTSLGSFL